MSESHKALRALAKAEAQKPKPIQPCECGHERWVHTSWGDCQVIGCKCKSFYPKEQR